MIPRLILVLLFFASRLAVAGDNEVIFESGPQSILIAKCAKCHGNEQLTRKAELNLANIAGVRRGGESGAVIQPGRLEESLLWTQIVDGAMPPEGETPLTESEREILRKWIVQGTVSSQATVDDAGIPESARDFWSFKPLRAVSVPSVRRPEQTETEIDRFLLAKLEQQQLEFSAPADRRMLSRRLALDLLGLPPAPEDVAAFEADPAPDAYEHLVDRLLASPHYGERWGRHWLDIVGYADSNGYHRADTPRPLAYRYRDYIVSAFNADKPYDRLWLEQLAGDELYRPDERDALRPEVAEALIATHFLRNAPDGTDSTEGNEMVQTIERYAVLEQQLQITISAMFALTIDCARCHSHKFDPIPQTDYYALQSLLYPAFNVREWVTPGKRHIQLATPDQLAHHAAETKRIDDAIKGRREELAVWSRFHRPPGTVRFADTFDNASGLADRWSNTAPADDGPAVPPGVQVGSDEAPAAHCRESALHIVDAGGGSHGWLATRQSFDWTPNDVGGAVQVTFDLLADRLTPEGSPAERIGFYLAMRDYDDSTAETGGNILCDGNPAGGAGISVDYPGADSQGLGTIGKTGFQPGHNYGVRITNQGDDRFELALLVDWLPEDGTITLTSEQLADGGFGFEYCCGRSFIVDNVSIEEFAAEGDTGTKLLAEFREQLQSQAQEVESAIAALEAERPTPPGEIAWVTDLSPTPPEVHVLKRGRYFDPGPEVVPAGLTVLSDNKHALSVPTEATEGGTTGRRRAFAEWATQPDSRAQALLARVYVNRLWMWHFGRGLVDPPDNFGAQGSLPSHPDLLEWLAGELVASGWSTKHIQRLILMSAAYRQSTQPSPAALAADPDDRLLWGFPPHRLESEAIRDSMVAVAGVLDDTIGGPPEDYRALPNGQIILSEADEDGWNGASRRTLYFRHRRSEPVTFLQTFDQPAAEPNCQRRATSAVVSQTLAMLNSRFAVRMSRLLADRVRAQCADDQQSQVNTAFQLALGRSPTPRESERAAWFLQTQADTYAQPSGDAAHAASQALTDFCQVLLASSEFIYLQ